MNRFEKNDGWRTKGTKQLAVKDIVVACNLNDRLEKQGSKNAQIITCHHEFELEKAQKAWAGFVRVNDSLYYKGVEIRKV
ncbi:MAG: hypothetical protein WC373_10900 [Smithella sp.]|jgi:hypothetical protein